MSKYSYLRFFNGVENELNLDYNSTSEKWTGVVYLPEVSVGLYETFNLFMLEELVDSTGRMVYGRPISENSSGSNFKFTWKDDRYSSQDVFIYGTSLENNTVKIQNLDSIAIQVLDHTDVVSVVAGLKTISDFTNDALQVNVALSSKFEKRHERTLLIVDDSDGHIVAEISIYGETVGEDERMHDLLQNMGATLDDGDFIIFKEHDINEMGIDWRLMNQKRRELLLELHNIKPFIGTYKAVLNAIDFFGYNNITLKEYWLNINQDSDSFGKLKAVSVPDKNAGFSYKKRKQFNLPSTTMKKTSRFSLDITGEGSYFDQKNLNFWNNQQPISSFNEGKDVEFKVYPENKQLYVEDYSLISNNNIIIDNVDFEPIDLSGFGDLNNTDHETLLSDFETFYNNYYIDKKYTFNNNTDGQHTIPVGAPIILECTSLPHEWEFANFTWLDAVDPTITWNNWWKQHVYELEWVVTGPNNYSQNFRGSIGYYEANGTFHPGYLRFPMIVPFEGNYSVELRMYDLQGFMSFRKEEKPDGYSFINLY